GRTVLANVGAVFELIPFVEGHRWRPEPAWARDAGAVLGDPTTGAFDLLVMFSEDADYLGGADEGEPNLIVVTDSGGDPLAASSSMVAVTRVMRVLAPSFGTQSADPSEDPEQRAEYAYQVTMTPTTDPGGEFTMHVKVPEGAAVSSDFELLNQESDVKSVTYAGQRSGDENPAPTVQAATVELFDAAGDPLGEDVTELVQGGSVKLTLDFSEEMRTSPSAPTIQFRTNWRNAASKLDLISNGYLTAADAGTWEWIESEPNSRYVITYDVAEDPPAAIDADDVDVAVTNAVSAEGAVIDGLNNGQADLFSMQLVPLLDDSDIEFRDVVLHDPDVEMTKGDEVTFRVNFSGVVDDETVNIGDFTPVLASDHPGVSVTSVVEATGGDRRGLLQGQVYIVTVSGLNNYNDQVGLELHKDFGILDVLGDQIVQAGPTGQPYGPSEQNESYTLDHAQPYIVSIERSDEDGITGIDQARPDGEKTVYFKVTFNEEVERVSSADWGIYPVKNGAPDTNDDAFDDVSTVAFVGDGEPF
ncbi:MAG: hypothetical protein HRU27_21240, partial [Rhizobiaceae bacterium]|nr:hypothetical protein [Hyphomicrobiales bacterium]NRB33113.1 hypothetical protein [Rhizobiaceae bacterium]